MEPTSPTQDLIKHLHHQGSKIITAIKSDEHVMLKALMAMTKETVGICSVKD
jgi:hypothetical protein